MSPAPFGKQDPRHSSAFFKLVAGIVLFVAFVAVGLVYLLGGPKPVTVDQLTAKAYEASLDFADAAVRTGYLLEKSEERYPYYSVWEEARQETLVAWEKAEMSAAELQELSARAVAQGEGVAVRLVSVAHAYDTEKLQAIFDAAPAGKRVQALADYLHTDAKAAYRILKGEMEMTAEKWDNVADRYQALETGATLVKDGCKVIVAVGTVYAAAGTMATAGAVQAAATIIPTADTFIEVGQDLCQITLGSGDQLTQMFGRMRTKTEGISTILAFANLGNAASKLEKVATGILTSVDALNSAAQEGKVLGFKVMSPDNILVDLVAPDEAKAWAAENGAKPSDLLPEDLVASLRDMEPGGLAEFMKGPGAGGPVVGLDGEGEVTMAEDEVPVAPPVVAPEIELPPPPVKPRDAVKARNFTPLQSFSVKNDYCGTGISAVYCKCAFHGQYCDSIDMEPAEANNLVYGGFEPWKERRIAQIMSSCTNSGGRWASGCERPPTCNDGYVLEGWNCVDIANYCGRDPYVTYNAKTATCGCVAGFEVVGSGTRTTCKYIVLVEVAP